MKSSNTSTVWPESLAQYKAFFDANPKYARIPEKEKIEIARHFMSSTYADPTNDWAFKWAFSNSPEDLRMLLIDILDEPIDTISIGTGDALAGTPSDKQATLDILCTTTDERQFIVEMQTIRKPDFRNRMFYYGAAAIHRQVKTGSKAYDYEPVRVVAILDYVTRHGQVPKGKALFQYMLLEKETAEQFGNQIRLYMLELPHAILSPDKNKVEEWCYFFKNLPNFVGVPQDINPRFYRIMDKLRIDKMTDAERTEYFKSGLDEYEREDIAKANYDYGREDGFDAGLEKGRAEGQDIAYKDLALKMLSHGLDISQVKRITGLSEEVVKNLCQAK